MVCMFKVYASGDSDQLNIFLSDLKSNPRYNVALETKEHYDINHKRGKMVMSVDIQTVTPMSVVLNTENGEQVTIDLLKSIVVKFDNDITYISGKVFDIFG